MHATEKASRDCWRCHEQSSDIVCYRCDALQPIHEDADYFRILGLARGLVIDEAELERRYHAASRAAHPDRHVGADARQHALALRVSASVNRAYRTLHDPIGRGRYWLELHGTPLGADNREVPPALAALVFETQERLEAVRNGDGARAEIDALHASLAARVDALRAELLAYYQSWRDPSAPTTLAELKRRLAEIAYLETLLRDVDAAREA